MKKRILSITIFALVIAMLLATVSFAANLQKGSKGTDVRYLQMNLNGIGISCGSADGAFGANTEKAVKAFQEQQGLSVDGIAGKKTLSAMKKIITAIQKDLNTLGYDCGSADGVFGSKTTTALKKFQKAQGLTADGIATESIRDALADAVSEAKAAKKQADKQASEAKKEPKKETETKKARIYVITYNANGGTKAPAKQNHTENTTSLISKQQPVRTGHIFLGWSDSKSGDVIYESGDKYEENDNITLYAVWEKEKVKQQLSDLETFEKTKSSVNKWYIVDEESTDKGTPLRSAPVSGDNITGYAKKNTALKVKYQGKNNVNNVWYQLENGSFIFSDRVRAAKSLSLTYNANGGAKAPASATMTESVPFKLSSSTPTLNGHAFAGWAESSSATSVKYTAGQEITPAKNLTLYAVWKKASSSTAKIAAGKYAPPANMESGKTYSISGVITADNNITSVTAGIYYSDGTATAQVKTVNPNAKSYDIKKLDKSIGFGELPDADYRFKVTVTESNGATKALVDNAFSVRNKYTKEKTKAIKQFEQKVLTTWIKPVEANYLQDIRGTGRGFGSSRDSGKRRHAAVDYVVKYKSSDTPVYAMQSGTVVEYMNNNFWAGTGCVAVKHDDGSVARYCEVRPTVKMGEKVTQGQQIATIIPNTNNNNSMLHLELYLGTSSGAFSQYKNKYDYVTGTFNRRADLINPDFTIEMTRTRANIK